jgi:hypothetical protein
VTFSGSSTNKAHRHDISEILLKVALNTIEQTKLTNSTNQKQELPVAAMFANGSRRNEQSL